MAAVKPSKDSDDLFCDSTTDSGSVSLDSNPQSAAFGITLRINFPFRSVS